MHRLRPSGHVEDGNSACRSAACDAGGVRVAVDIGGTFTDIVVMSGDGILHESKISTTPDDPSRAVVAGLQALLVELGIPARQVEEVLHGTTVGSNTILQRSGAQDRADHHARLPRRAGDRPHPHARHVRPHLGQAQAAGAAPASAGGRRAHRGRRRHRRAAQRGERRCGGRAAGGRGHPGGRHLPHQQLPQSRARAARRGDPAPALPRAAGDGLLRRAARAQGIRAHQHDGGERLPAGRHARLPAQPRKRPALDRHRRADPRDHLQRRHAGGRHRLREAGVRGGLGPGRRRDRRGAAGRGARRSPTSSCSTWAARRPRPSSSRTDGRA